MINSYVKYIYKSFYNIDFSDTDKFESPLGPDSFETEEEWNIKDTNWAIVPILPDGLCFLECIERMSKPNVEEQSNFKETLINYFRQYIAQNCYNLGLLDCNKTQDFINGGTYNWNTLYGEVFPQFVKENKHYDFTILNENNSKLEDNCRFYLDRESNLNSLNDILGFVETKYVLLRHGCKGSEHYTLLYRKTK